MDTTKIIDMSKYFESQCETAVIGTTQATKSLHIQYLCKHARTMVMMYEASGDTKYLQQAKKDLDLAHTIKVGFLRPLGVTQKEAA